MAVTQDNVEQKTNSFLDSIANDLLAINDNAVGAFSEFLDRVTRPDGSPDLSITEAQLCTETADLYERLHRNLGDQNQAMADSVKAAGDLDLAKQKL